MALLVKMVVLAILHHHLIQRIIKLIQTRMVLWYQQLARMPKLKT